MTTHKKIILSILAVVVLVLLYGLTTYNGLVTMKEGTTAQWQQVETQYQRRLDLIPNLVAATQGIMKQETAVFTALADARARYSGATTQNDKVAAANQVESAFGRLLAIVENYPTLKSSDAVQSLMVENAGTENRIAVERQRYNTEVQAYEVAIKRFPRSVIASMFGFDDVTYFKSDTGADKAPQVKF
ncbi:MAG: LemA family protein [Candidatus Pacebacteria bacterium]|nr:LemA family protein [Candidatus Paceibacterota bacterium]